MNNECAGEMVELDGRAFIKTKIGVAGRAAYGRNEVLEPGTYKVEYSIEHLDEAIIEDNVLCAIADVFAEHEGGIVEVFVFRSFIESNNVFTIYFTTDRKLNGIECRLFVNGVEPLLIGMEASATRVEQVGASSQRDIIPLFVHENLDRLRALFFAGVRIMVREHDLIVISDGSQFTVRTPDDLNLISRNILRDVPKANLLTNIGAGYSNTNRKAATLIIAIGTHTAYGHWGFALLGYVMDEIYGGHRRIQCLNLPELRDHWGEAKGEPLLITSDRPDTALSYLLTTSGFPMLAFFDDPLGAVAFPVFFEDLSLQEALRFSTQNFSCLAGCTASKGVKIFDEKYFEKGILEFVENIFVAIGAEVNALATARVVDRLVAGEGLGPDATVGDLVRRRMNGESLLSLAQRRFDVSEWDLVEWFDRDYGSMLTARPRDSIEWPRELFLSGARGETGARDFELIGGARYILWGPYLNLPVGGWRAHVQFEVVDNPSGNEIEADVWTLIAEAQLAKRIVKLPIRGYFELTLEFVNNDPVSPIEIRLRLLRGAIEGRFALRRVVLRRVADLENLAADPALKRLQAAQRGDNDPSTPLGEDPHAR